jgi:hypothetical protein
MPDLRFANKHLRFAKIFQFHEQGKPKVHLVTFRPWTGDAMSERRVEQSLFGAEHVFGADHDGRDIVAAASFESHLDERFG